jgi:hypothetical protein
MSTFYTGVDKQRYDAGEKFLPMNQFLKSYTPPKTKIEEGVTTSYGIPATNAFTGGGGGGYYPGSTSQLLTDFNAATRDRQKRLESPNWITQQFNKFTGSGQRPVSEMVTGSVGNFSRMPIDTQNFGLAVSEDEGQYGPMRTFERDQRSLNQIPLGVGSLISKALPDKYYSDFTLPQQAYTQLNMGYTGPTIFGENTSGLNKDIFGRNVRHTGERSYNETQQRDIDKLDALWGVGDEDVSKAFKGKDYYSEGLSLEFDDESGQYMFKENGVLTANALKANQMNKLNLSRYNYDKAGVLKFNTMNKAHEKNLANRKRWEDETAREQDWADKKFKETGDYDEYSGAGGTWSGPVGPQPKDKDYADPGADAAENQSYQGGADQGTKGSWTPGGSYNQGGRVGLDLGGLASMLGRTGFANGGPGFYGQVDQDIYEGGSHYVPMDQFRTSPFDYNQLRDISYDSAPINMGIASTLGKPPIINVGGEGKDDDDDETTDTGGWYDEYGNMKDTFSFTDLGAFVTNPIGFMAYKSYPSIKAAIQKKQFEKDLQNPDFRDMVTENKAAGIGGHQAGWDNDFMDGPSDASHGNAPSDKGGSDTMGSH